MKSKKIIAVVGGSFLLAAAFLLILCIKFVNMKESSPTGKYAGKTEKVEQTTTDKKEQKKPDWVEEKISGMTLEEKVAQLFIITPEALTGMGKVTADKKMPGTVSGWWHDLFCREYRGQTTIIRYASHYAVVQYRAEWNPDFSECR